MEVPEEEERALLKEVHDSAAAAAGAVEEEEVEEVEEEEEEEEWEEEQEEEEEEEEKEDKKKVEKKGKQSAIPSMSIPAAIPAMSTAGSSKSSESQNKTVVAAFERFTNSSPALKAKYPLPFAKLPESTVCNQELYKEWAFDLVIVSVVNRWMMFPVTWGGAPSTTT